MTCPCHGQSYRSVEHWINTRPPVFETPWNNFVRIERLDSKRKEVVQPETDFPISTSMLVIMFTCLVCDTQSGIGKARPAPLREELQSIAHRFAHNHDALLTSVFNESSSRYPCRERRRAGEHDDFTGWRNQFRQIAREAIRVQLVAATVVAQIEDHVTGLNLPQATFSA